tara:strand:- start:8722 stop:9234 length:513 start_codon:yes stop_codon:yes gene_type:complete
MSYVKKTCEVFLVPKKSFYQFIKTPISDIQIGDVIKTYDDLSEKWSTDVVTAIHKNKLSDFIDFNIELGYEGIGYFSINKNPQFQCVATSSLLALIGWSSFFSLSHNKPFSTGTPLVNLERNFRLLIMGVPEYECIDSIEFIPCQDELVYSLSLKNNYSYIVGGYVMHTL